MYSINDGPKARNKYKIVGGNANTALKNAANDLATACDIPFNELVSLSEMETIEDKLNCNLYILNIRDLPLHETNTHLYNMLLYFSDDKQSNKYWLLYDGINEHFHALTDVRKIFNL